MLAAAFHSWGIGLSGMAFAFGLTVLTTAYAIAHISGSHLNRAVTVGLVVGGRFKFAASLDRTLTGVSLNSLVAWVREIDGLRRALAA